MGTFRLTALNAAQRRAVLAHPAGWIATGFGIGFSPLAPGTVGSLAALLPWFMLRELPRPAYFIVIAAVFALGVWAARVVGARTGVHDPGAVVIDEFVGQWLALAFAPPGYSWTIGGFLLFRFCDIAKPWPVSWADRCVGGGIGVMLDDALAGALAGAVLAAIAALV